MNVCDVINNVGKELEKKEWGLEFCIPISNSLFNYYFKCTDSCIECGESDVKDCLPVLVLVEEKECTTLTITEIL